MKKKIFKVVMLGLLSLLAVLTPFLPYAKLRPRLASSLAYADEIVNSYSYRSSAVYLPMSGYTKTTTSGGTYYDNAVFLDTMIDAFLENSNNAFINFNIYQYENSHNCYYYYYHMPLNFLNIAADTWYIDEYNYSNDGYTYYFRYSYYMNSSSFNFNIHRVDYGGSTSNQFFNVAYQTLNTATKMGTNYISFYDVNGNYFSLYVYGFQTINFVNRSNVDPTYRFINNRSYYLSGDLSDSEIYINGKEQGYADGYAQGQTDGYTSGYNTGDAVGYNRGYNAGATAANTYTFTGLISAVIDVPVRTFTSLFHFEILGVYMDGFFLGLLTLCIIVFIVKLLI